MKLAITNVGNQIEVLLTEVLNGGQNEEDVTRIMRQVMELFKQDPTLGQNLAMVDRISKTIDTISVSGIQETWRALNPGDVPASDSLTISESDLPNVGKDFWDKIDEKVTTLTIITQSEEPIVYGDWVLRQLVEKRPEPSSLAEVYTLKFANGDELKGTKANLLLCGAMLEGLFSFMTEETQDRSIPLHGDVLLDSFKRILQEVKTGIRDSSNHDDAYEIACDYLGYSKWKGYPEGAFGPDEYENYFGIKVEDAPPVPKEYLKIFNGPCGIYEGKQASKTRMLFLLVKDEDLETLKEKAKNPKRGHKTEKGFEFIYSKIMEVHGKKKVKKTRWVLMTIENLPNSYYLGTYDKYMAKAAEYGLKAPSILEASVGMVTWHVRTGERLFDKNEKGLLIFTFCRDEPVNKYKVNVVGGFGSAGPYVYYCCGHSRVGVAGVLRRK